MVLKRKRKEIEAKAKKLKDKEQKEAAAFPWLQPQSTWTVTGSQWESWQHGWHWESWCGGYTSFSCTEPRDIPLGR